MMLTLAEAVLSDRAREFLEYMKWDFREGRGSSTEIGRQIAMVVAAFLIFVVVLYSLSVAQRRRNHPVAHQPRKLFRTLLRTLDISLGDRILLQWVARSSGLRQPTAILLSPELLKLASRRWSERVILTSARTASWTRLSRVCEKIHGQPFSDD